MRVEEGRATGTRSIHLIIHMHPMFVKTILHKYAKQRKNDPRNARAHQRAKRKIAHACAPTSARKIRTSLANDTARFSQHLSLAWQTRTPAAHHEVSTFKKRTLARLQHDHLALTTSEHILPSPRPHSCQKRDRTSKKTPRFFVPFRHQSTNEGTKYVERIRFCAPNVNSP